MHRHTAQKQTRTLKNPHSSALSDIRNVIRTPLRPMTASGILFVSLAATAGFTTLAIAMQQQAVQPSASAGSPSTLNDTQSSVDISDGSNSLEVTTSSQSTQETPTDLAPDSTPPATSGQMTINDEVVPLGPGTTERSYTDSNGNQHTVTVTIDDQSTTVNSSSDSSSVHISSSSNTSVEHNTTRGSPRR